MMNHFFIYACFLRQKTPRSESDGSGRAVFFSLRAERAGREKTGLERTARRRAPKARGGSPKKIK
jgi:hypothetical protein